MLQVGHEIAEQEREENHAQHLAFSRSLDNVGRHHAFEDFGNIAGALTFDFRADICCWRIQCQNFSRRLTVNISRCDRVDHEKSDQNGEEGRRAVEQQCPPTKRANVSARANSGNANNDR